MRRYPALYLLALAPCHIGIAQSLLVLLAYAAPANLIVQLAYFIPLYVVITTALSCWVLGRWVIPAPDRPAYFGIKAVLGTGLWTTFVAFAALHMVVGGYLNVFEAVIAAILLLIAGNGLMLRFLWMVTQSTRD